MLELAFSVFIFFSFALNSYLSALSNYHASIPERQKTVASVIGESFCLVIRHLLKQHTIFDSAVPYQFLGG